jgi:hypothetical protein
VFLDFETGVHVKTGGVLRDGAPLSSPCRRAYEVFCRINLGWCRGTDRCSWDIQALVYAVRGPEDFYTLQPGHNDIDPRTGRNTWTAWTPPPIASKSSTVASNETNTSNESSVAANETDASNEFSVAFDKTVQPSPPTSRSDEEPPAEFTLLLPPELYKAVEAEINELLLQRPLLR